MSGAVEQVVVTGASGGIGRAVAQAFGARGAKVALLARGELGLQGAAKDVKAAGGTAVMIPVDIADHEQVERAAQQVEQEWGPIDVWVNVAFTSVFAPFMKTAPPTPRMRLLIDCRAAFADHDAIRTAVLLEQLRRDPWGGCKLEQVRVVLRPAGQRSEAVPAVANRRRQPCSAARLMAWSVAVMFRSCSLRRLAMMLSSRSGISAITSVSPEGPGPMTDR
jgi:NAD(P)-dependent dehydrogenase (short-subunit alcohol dehydrogenase family)